MLEDKIKEVVLSPKKISSIVFSHNNVRYRANVSPSRIVLSKNSSKDKNPIAEYNTKTGKDSWYLDHICNSKSFEELGATCYACNEPKLDAVPENVTLIATNGKYTPELSEILCHDLPAYIKKYESLVKNI